MKNVLSKFFVLLAVGSMLACSSSDSTVRPAKKAKARSARPIAQPKQPEVAEPVAKPVPQRIRNSDEKVTADKELSLIIQPAEPTAEDAISVQVYGYGDDTPTFVWYRNEHEISRSESATLPPGQLSKDDRVKVAVFAGERRGNAEVVVANQKPIFTSVPPLRKHKGAYIADIKGTDPDGDRIFLVLPAPVKGVHVDGMRVVIDPNVFGSEKRTIPVGLSDGEDVAGYLYNIQIKTEEIPTKKKTR